MDYTKLQDKTDEEKVKILRNAVSDMAREIEYLRLDKMTLEARNDELRRSISNNFRVLGLALQNGIPPDVNRMHAEMNRANWASAPVELIMEYLDIIEAHREVFIDLIQIRTGKHSIKIEVERRNIDKAKMVEIERAKPIVQAKIKEEKKVVRNCSKAVAALMKTLGLSQEDAEGMVNGVVKK